MDLVAYQRQLIHDSDTTDSDATIDVIAPKKLLNTLYITFKCIGTIKSGEYQNILE